MAFVSVHGWPGHAPFRPARMPKRVLEHVEEVPAAPGSGYNGFSKFRKYVSHDNIWVQQGKIDGERTWVVMEAGPSAETRYRLKEVPANDDQKKAIKEALPFSIFIGMIL